MSTPRYLTKSRFKLACECPTKLFYTNKPQYADTSLHDPFLRELAAGGFQVGELAKCYFPEGIEVDELNYDRSVERTEELLQLDDVTIFEAAIRHEDLFVRVDILKKQGGRLELIEVKSKSYDPAADAFFGSRGEIGGKWEPYLYDVAFQKFVAMQRFPDLEIAAFLMMTDKSAACPTDGLNQKFRIANVEGRSRVYIYKPITDVERTTRILTMVNVDEECRRIYEGTDKKQPPEQSFAERVRHFAESYKTDTKIVRSASRACKSCQFQATPEDEAAGKLSGFKECWSETLGWKAEDFAVPTIFKLWDCRRTDDLITEGKLRLSELSIEDLNPKPTEKPGLSRTERQWLQIMKCRDNDATHYIDGDGLAAEMNRWKFPLHFLDFEAATPAIPFTAGRRPYERVVFQYSHHVVHADGRVVHQGDYLNTDVGVFPNVDFLRALCKELSADDGTIFQYSQYENTCLSDINDYIASLSEPPEDLERLREFVLSITRKVDRQTVIREGERCMVDMLDLVKQYYYHPRTEGSNSIKQVLPATLHASDYLREKYSRPVYGAEIPSLNFGGGWTWYQIGPDGDVIDPYKLLEPMFKDADEHDIEILSDEERIQEGAAAMAAYARLQFEDMSDYERNEIRGGLLRYCELDTLAMVLIYEAWREMV